MNEETNSRQHQSTTKWMLHHSRLPLNHKKGQIRWNFGHSFTKKWNRTIIMHGSEAATTIHSFIISKLWVIQIYVMAVTSSKCTKDLRQTPTQNKSKRHNRLECSFSLRLPITSAGMAMTPKWLHAKHHRSYICDSEFVLVDSVPHLARRIPWNTSTLHGTSGWQWQYATENNMNRLQTLHLSFRSLSSSSSILTTALFLSLLHKSGIPGSFQSIEDMTVSSTI